MKRYIVFLRAKLMNFLETIVAAKTEEVAVRKRLVFRTRLEDMPGFSASRMSFAAICRRSDMAFVAELPAPVLRPGHGGTDPDPAQAARRACTAGAAGIAVHTDERFSRGSLDTLGRIRRAVQVPLLRLDFIVDPYQLYEARAYGADAVSLIVAAVGHGRAGDLAIEARAIGLEPMAVVHDLDELDRIDWTLFDLAGIDNTDPMTFETDVMTSVRLRKYLPADAAVISMGGIGKKEDLRLLARQNIRAVLVYGDIQ